MIVKKFIKLTKKLDYKNYKKIKRKNKLCQ